ncbi:uncharacterized protein LOC128850652 isoform X2 [Cuculus canorus]|uniref:uncharacterized protein LOC128850652 isoform X2 n=1 Tax=Cuculus canorus TaxID=55661 RepID=UPI0023AA9D21|nr:uncharacterized protein LOC128850652 isoform X2 [Cuculus canorus]
MRVHSSGCAEPSVCLQLSVQGWGCVHAQMCMCTCTSVCVCWRGDARGAVGTLGMMVAQGPQCHPSALQPPLLPQIPLAAPRDLQPLHTPPGEAEEEAGEEGAEGEEAQGSGQGRRSPTTALHCREHLHEIPHQHTNAQWFIPDSGRFSSGIGSRGEASAPSTAA